jgi:hypothetical protein
MCIEVALTLPNCHFLRFSTPPAFLKSVYGSKTLFNIHQYTPNHRSGALILLELFRHPGGFSFISLLCSGCNKYLSLPPN